MRGRGVLLGVGGIFLGGCFLLPSGEPSRVEEVPSDLRRAAVAAPPVGDRHPYGEVERLEVGQWVRVREEGGVFTLAVVGREAGGTWVEVVEEGTPRVVSARLVAPGGGVKRAWYAEVPAAGRPVPVPQEIRPGAAPPAREPEELSRETGEERHAVAGRELAARRVRVLREDAEGRLVEEVSLWHPEVPPVYAGSEYGGLILRRVGSRTVAELLDFGSGARPLLDLPR